MMQLPNGNIVFRRGCEAKECLGEWGCGRASEGVRASGRPGRKHLGHGGRRTADWELSHMGGELGEGAREVLRLRTPYGVGE